MSICLGKKKGKWKWLIRVSVGVRPQTSPSDEDATLFAIMGRPFYTVTLNGKRNNVPFTFL